MLSQTFVVACLLQISSSYASWSGCPNVQLQADFNTTKYYGTWYQHYASKELPYPDDGECTTAQYYPKEDGNIKVVNTQQKWTDSSKTTLRKTRKIGEATARKRDSNSDLGDLQVNFISWLPIWMSYTILYTDYENHSLVYSCSGSFWGYWQSQNFYILTRKPLDIKSSKDKTEVKAARDIANKIWNINLPGKYVWETLKYSFQGK